MTIVSRISVRCLRRILAGTCILALALSLAGCATGSDLPWGASDPNQIQPGIPGFPRN